MTSNPPKLSFSSRIGLALVNPWVQLVGALIVAITFWLTWQTYFASSILSYTVRPSTSLLYLRNSNPNQLDLMVGGKLVRAPFLTEMHIENSGNKSIRVEDFTDSFCANDTSLQIRPSNEHCKIMTCDVTSMKPPERKEAQVEIISTAVTDKQKVSVISLKPIALNSGDGFDLQIISEGNPGQVKVWGNLADCKIQKAWNFDEWTPLMTKLWTVGVTVGAVFGTLAFILLVFCYLAITSSVKWGFEKLGNGLASMKFTWNLHKKVPTASKAEEILLSQSQFDVLAEELNANLNQREEIRKALAKKVEEAKNCNTPIDVPMTTSQNQEQATESNDDIVAQTAVSPVEGPTTPT